MALGTYYGRSTLGIASGRSALGVRMGGNMRFIAYASSDRQTVVLINEASGSLYRTISSASVIEQVALINETHADDLELAGVMTWDNNLNLYVAYQVGDDHSGTVDAYLAKYTFTGALQWVAYAGIKSQLNKVQSVPAVFEDGAIIYAQKIISRNGTTLATISTSTETLISGNDLYETNASATTLNQYDVSSGYPPTFVDSELFPDYAGNAGPLKIHANGWIAMPFYENSPVISGTWSAVAGFVMIKSDLSQTASTTVKSLSSSDPSQIFYRVIASAQPFEDGWIAGFDFGSSTRRMVYINDTSNSETQGVTLGVPLINISGDWTIENHTAYYVTNVGESWYIGKTLLTKTGSYQISSSTQWQTQQTGSIPLMAADIDARIAVSPLV